MARFIIQGGKQLTGRHKPAGNKNAALPMLAACVLTDEPVCLQNLPLIEDVHCMLRILEALGASVDLKGHTVTICCKSLKNRHLPADLCRKVRSSILFAGPLAARHGRAVLSPPGGDVIGRRRLDTHFDGLAQLGIQFEGHRDFQFKRHAFAAADILLDEASVTATENVVMAAVLAPGQTTIFNAACEPHVQDLCRLLNRMGARIRGIGTNFLRIQGVSSLHGVRYRIAPDYVDAASFMAAAVLTGGELVLEDMSACAVDIIGRPFRKMGIDWTAEGDTLSLPGHQKLKVRDDFGSSIPKVEDGPWPAFPSDLMSVSIVMATQAKGAMLFFEKMFESRMYFVDRLIEMGARIVQCDPHRVIVTGPARLQGLHLSSPDIRAGMAMVLAALCAKGKSIIDNVQCIDRGYERIEVELQRLGADIVRAES